eukprot:1161619-Pelagomonas_calceolata.AAC.7
MPSCAPLASYAGAYLAKAPAEVVSGGHLVAVLGVFQKLLASKVGGVQGHHLWGPKWLSAGVQMYIFVPPRGCVGCVSEAYCIQGRCQAYPDTNICTIHVLSGRARSSVVRMLNDAYIQ